MNFGFTSGKAKKTGPSKKWTEREITAKIAEFDAKIEDVKEREGDVEVRDAILYKKDAYYDPDDVWPFLALYYWHIPTLLVRNIMKGNRWAKIDLCIGKLTEVNGD